MTDGFDNVSLPLEAVISQRMMTTMQLLDQHHSGNQIRDVYKVIEVMMTAIVEIECLARGIDGPDLAPIEFLD